MAKKRNLQEYTILAPMMAPIHFSFIKKLFACYGYNIVLLTNGGQSVIEHGLKYVHNDTCYPALLVIGQMIEALESGKYDLNNTAVMITQTGGGCRASNYLHLLKKAIKKAGFDTVPVISLNLSGLEKDSSLKITFSMLRRAIAALIYGDLLMLLKNQTKPYEANKGDSDALVEKWENDIILQFDRNTGYSRKDVRQNAKKIVQSFEQIPIKNIKKIKVGVVGEIYVKYSDIGNNNLEDFLLSQDCEINVPGLLGFIQYMINNRLSDIELYGGNIFKRKAYELAMKYISSFEMAIIDALKGSRYTAPSTFEHTKSLVKGVIGYGSKMGEGWLLTAEMLELIENGYNNIICTQPFGCLPNHIVGKGMIRKIRELHANANIVPIDYDPGATKVNQENRIKLMLSVAKEESISEKAHSTKHVEESDVVYA